MNTNYEVQFCAYHSHRGKTIVNCRKEALTNGFCEHHQPVVEDPPNWRSKMVVESSNFKNEIQKDIENITQLLRNHNEILTMIQKKEAENAAKIKAQALARARIKAQKVRDKEQVMVKYYYVPWFIKSFIYDRYHK